MPATSVKVFHSSMPGAPTLTGAAGSLIALLDACLINGFGLKTVDSLVVSGGVATATISSGHSFEVGSVALIAGATPSALNGERRVAEITTTTVKFSVSGVPDGTAAGTITIKVAPLGWIKQYSGRNVAVYKRSAPEATAMVLQVDDTATLNARARGFESMSAVNTGIGPFPTNAQLSGGFFWAKASTTTDTRSWVVLGDERCFYYAVAPNEYSPLSHHTHFFGDIIPFKSGDAYCCALTGSRGDRTNTGADPEGCVGLSHATAAGLYLARGDSGIGGAVQGEKLALSHTNTWSGASNWLGAYPNRADNGLYVEEVFCHSQGTFRGRLPGVYHLTQYALGFFGHLDKIVGVGPYAGKTFLNLLLGGSSSSNNTNPTFFDFEGPWR